MRRGNTRTLCGIGKGGEEKQETLCGIGKGGEETQEHYVEQGKEERKHKNIMWNRERRRGKTRENMRM